MIKFSHETIPLHKTSSGSKFEIDVWRYSHPKANETVYLQAGIHGIELTGIPVVHEFIKEIEKNQLKYNLTRMLHLLQIISNLIKSNKIGDNGIYDKSHR